MWPENKKFAVCLSHDVDRVRKTYQYITHFKKSRYIGLSYLSKTKNPYWNFEKIMDIEERYGVRSTFFFLQESKKINLLKPKEWALSGGKYKFNNKHIRKVIQLLDQNEWEIALHGSFESYETFELLRKEKTLLEDVVGHNISGIRQHYLNLKIPSTWDFQKIAGFKYDSSFGLRNKIGFREEEFVPFQPFNDDFIVIPLALMDSYLMELSENIDDAWKRMENLFNLAEKRGALLSVLWHQRVFNEKEFPGYSTLYEKLIKRSLEMNAWIAKCIDVYNLVSLQV